MKAEKRLWVLVIACAVMLVMGGISVAKDTAKKEPAAQKVEQKGKTQAIEAAASTISKDHPDIPEGVTCVDCHEIKFDAKSTATEAWLYGQYLKYGPNEGVMPQDKIKEEIVRIIGGKKAKKTFVLGTCINNTPMTTTADFALDPDTMTLYGLHEKGTAKLYHIQQNPRVSMNWHKEFESWGDVNCGQFIGTAEVLEGGSPEFEKVLVAVYPYEEMAKNMHVTPEQARAMIQKGMQMSKITISQATMNISAFEKEGMRKYQRWMRTGR